MNRDNAVSEVVAVLLLIAIAVGIIGIIAVFFYSNMNVQRVPEVDLSFSTNSSSGTLSIYEQRGESLSYKTTQFIIGTATVPKSNRIGELYLKKKNQTAVKSPTYLPKWSDNPDLLYTIGDSLIWIAPDRKVDNISVDVIYNLTAGNALLIDKIGYQSGESGSGGSKTVTVISPWGGERWEGGTPHIVTWTTFNITATSYTLEYSTDGGSTWTTVETNIPGSNTSYYWEHIPIISTDEAQVRITATEGDGTTTSGDSNNFIIYLPSCSTRVTALFSTVPYPPITTANTLSVTFTDHSTSADSVNYPITTWIWDFGDGTILRGQGPQTHTYDDSPGAYYARLTVSNGCKDETSGGVYVSVGNPDTNRSSVTVTSPNGGEDWTVGTTQTITWTPDHLVAGSYDIQYSIDGGATWITVATDLPGTSTSYSWVVPNTPTTDALVKVTGTDGTGTDYTDQSDNVFTISAPVLTVTSPVGGENWPIGSTHEITWTAENVSASQYSISYSVDGPSGTFTPITTVDGSIYSYDWPVTGPGTSNAVVKVTALDSSGNPIIADDSNVFTISQPVLTVTSPDGGENWPIGSTHEITWTAENVSASQYSISYSVDGPSGTFTPITTVNGSVTSYDWPVTGPATTNAVVKVTALDSSGNPIIADDSNVFTISAPVLTVTTPAGGENWPIGSTHEIDWNAQNVNASQYVISYSVDGPSGTFTPITTVNGSVTSYDWPVTGPATTNAVVKVTALDSSGNPIIADDSNVFTISAPVLTVTTPAGGENWPIGSTHEIDWNAQNVNASQYVISYSVDGPSGTFTPITTVGGSATSYDWPVTGPATTNAVVKVTALDSSGNPIIADDSNVFTISAPVLTVTTPAGGENWPIGSTHEIDWTVQNVNASQYVISYSVDGPSGTFTPITTVGGSVTSYDWPVTGPATTNAVVKVTALDSSGNPIIADDSNVFTISQPVLTVTTPAGGENWPIGSTHEIDWTVQNVNASQYVISYSVDGPSGTFTPITTVSGSVTSYDWPVTGPATTNAVVKVTALDSSGNPIIADDSNVFTISQPVLTVTTPAGGENWPIGSTHEIDWTVQNVNASQYVISYSVDGPSGTFTPITTVSGSVTSYDWPVTGPATTNAVVKVTALDSSGNPIIADDSNVFTISQPVLTVTTPAGGENWPIGSTHEIDWDCAERQCLAVRHFLLC